jgi:hypothetical protein
LSLVVFALCTLRSPYLRKRSLNADSALYTRAIRFTSRATFTLHQRIFEPLDVVGMLEDHISKDYRLGKIGGAPRRR